MTRDGLLDEFDKLIERLSDPDSHEAWSSEHTALCVRRLRGKVDAAVLELETRATVAERKLQLAEPLVLKPMERWG